MVDMSAEIRTGHLLNASQKSTTSVTPDAVSTATIAKIIISAYWAAYISIVFFVVILGTAATTSLLYKPQMIDDGD
jgi:hypothetical protein